MAKQEWFVIEGTDGDVPLYLTSTARRWTRDIRSASWYAHNEAERLHEMFGDENLAVSPVPAHLVQEEE